MAKFWQKKYTSKYTGAEIDAAVAKAADATKVTANPSLAGTESALTGLEVGETKYKVEQPIFVEANPVLTGNEGTLESIRIGSTSYFLPGHAIVAPESFVTRITTALASMASALVADNKYHLTGITVQTTDTDFEEIRAYIIALIYSFSDGSVTYTDCGSDIGVVPVSENFVSGDTHVNFGVYTITPLGLGHLLVSAYEQGTDAPVVISFYAQRVDVAT